MKRKSHSQARRTAQNVLFNVGRAVGAPWPLAVGALAAKYSFNVAIALLASIYVVVAGAGSVIGFLSKAKPLTTPTNRKFRPWTRRGRIAVTFSHRRFRTQ
jgi:hypothetical protein